MNFFSVTCKFPKKQLLCLGFILVLGTAFGQRDLKSGSVFTPIYGVTYKGAFPAGDFADRWGYTNALGLEANFKLKTNLTFGIETQFMFGNTFRDSAAFSPVFNSNNQITSISGAPGDILFLLRGGNYTGQLGYVFTKVGENPNAGLWVNLGVGFMHHKINVQAIYDQIPQFKESYIKGYDKLTMGLSTKQFIGYLQQGDKDFFSFYAGVELAQGFTKNVRTYNFDTEGPENDLRFDMTIGFKVGWMIPIYKRQLQEYYY